jgi:hypothetical protein
MWREAAVAALLFAGVTGTAPAAEAGGADPGTKRVIGGFTAVSPCGALSGIGVAWNSTGGVVGSVDLTAIPAGCIGGALLLTLMGSGGTALGSIGPITVTGTSQTLTVSATASNVTAAAIAVSGP